MRLLKCNLLCFIGAVFVSQVPIGFHAKCAAVLMADPTGDGWEHQHWIRCARGEQVAQIVMGDAFHPGQLGGTVN